ncbi:MAG: efflux RND transporter periplasmic adaptor subunit [Acidobacteriia bacterium]|nr:efflux RND transporter periplasmic adaptor subunit [Terriglobia bacterium]
MTVEEIKTPETEAKPRRSWRAVPVVVLLAAAGALGFGIRNGVHARTREGQALARATEQAATPVVRVVHPTPGAPLQEIVLPGNTQAFTDSPIYARTSGYLSRWYFDIGARVKKGDLLAEIETPEVDQQLQQAQAQLETAQANYDLSKTTAERWQALLKTNSVSKQETDQAIANMAAQKAVVDSNSANVRRLQQLQSFEKVYAPFDGVVTARSTDIGALIDAGSSTQSRELFHMAAISTLRVFVPVPEVYSNVARPGATATLTLDEYPGRVFHGKLARNSSAIDPASRTLLVEVDVDNPGGLLLPGAYVSVHLKLPAAIRSSTIPANTLLFRREGLRVAVVRDGHADLVPITIGRDYGAKVEVVSGLRVSDAIVLDPSDSLESGAAVRLQSGGSE